MRDLMVHKDSHCRYRYWTQSTYNGMNVSQHQNRQTIIVRLFAVIAIAQSNKAQRKQLTQIVMEVSRSKFQTLLISL